MSILELQHINVEYSMPDGKVLRANRNVNLKVSEGEIVAVVGESGCGKSTLGKVALGRLEPDSGRVLLEGENIWSPSFYWTVERRSRIQVVHQDPFSSLNPVRTIRETLEAPLALSAQVHGTWTDLRRRARSLLEMVGLDPPDFYLDKYPFQLSGGQKQRVSIARATIMKPKLIIADEPVSAVDASMRLSILDLMRELCDKSGISFIYVTHDLATSRYFARDGRVIVMYLGEIIEQGPIGRVLANPLHPYLKALLAAIPCPDPRRASVRRELPLKSYDVPSPVDLPPGCSFRPRCPCSVEKCVHQSPLLERVDDEGHFVACHLVDKR